METEVSPEHAAMMQEVKELLQKVVHAELLRIFEERPGTHIDGLDGAVLRYLSRICKVHEETVLPNAVDNALQNAFDVYRKVTELEEMRIRMVCGDMLDRYHQNLKAHLNNMIIHP